MFSFVMVMVPASASLSVMATQNGRKMLVVEPLGIRLWGQPALELARLHKAGQDAVLMGYLRPIATQNGQTFPAITITSVRPANQPAVADELDEILGQTERPQIKANGRPKKTLAKALSE